MSTDTKEELPTGHLCQCGKFHEWPAYVYAEYRREHDHATVRAER